MAWPETVRRSDLRIETMRGSGKGGQNRNKRDTCVRITHIHTGIAVRCEEQRTQEQNFKLAFRRLADKLIPIMVAAAKAPKVEFNPITIRTYHGVDNRVTDKRLPGKVFNYSDVLDHYGLEKIINALEEQSGSQF